LEATMSNITKLSVYRFLKDQPRDDILKQIQQKQQKIPKDSNFVTNIRSRLLH
jgi:hypothetical protein